MEYSERTKDYFLKACRDRSKVEGGVINRWWERVVEHYAEKQRHYHTMAHIWDMLSLLERMCPDVVRKSAAVLLAIIFHDLGVIYEPQKHDNEEKSAKLFEEFAAECLDEDKVLRQSVADYILLTKAHCTEEHQQEGMFGSSEAHYVLDLDMSVLGWAKQDYVRYSEAIRNEYSHIPTEMYRQHRAAVLRIFLKQRNIFATRIFRERFEAQARENLQNEIRELEAPMQ